VGDKDKIFTSDNEALNDFVFATDLFQQVKDYVVLNGHIAKGAARRK
jgi:phospholipid/cholesterol/gamma-HCH transport system ATP-binding protein